MLLLLAVLSCELTATLDARAPYAVELSYRLEPSPEARTLAFTLLEAKGARVDDVRVDGRAVSLDRSGAPQLRGEVELARGATTLSFRYDVTGTSIPVAVPLAEASEARPSTFSAELRLPDGMYLVESFPTGIRARGDVHVLELPIVPAFVSLTLADERPWLSFPAMMDAFVLLFLGSLGVLALRFR